MGPTFSGLPVRTLTGKIKIHPVGYGFVVPDDKSEDVHVSARNRGTAMDADTVEIEAWPGVRGVEGRVTRVLSRGRAKITGQLVRRGKHQVLQPDDPRITGLVSLSGSIPEARDGIAVVAEITRYPDVPDGPIEATVLKVLGDPDDPRTEVEKVLACADVEEEFPDEVERIAAAFGDTITLSDRVDRADLREVPFTTIDPETARDFDDAVALEKLPHGGSRLWVAVADVSHYVREGSPLDDEARRRGCSIYLPSRAIPMLPEPLSARMCSLVPEEDRLAMVVRIDLDRARQRGRPGLHGGGDPLEGAARLPGRGGGAGGRHARQAKEVRALLAGAAGDGLAGPPAARGAAGPGRARLRSPRAVRGARSRRSPPRARHPQVAPRSGRAPGLLDDRGVHAGRQRGGRRQLSRARRRHPLAHPRRPRPRAVGRVRGAGRKLRHRRRHRRGAHAQGVEAGARQAAGTRGRKGAVVPAAPLAQAGDLRRGEHRPLRAGLGRLPALHLADPALSGSDRPPAAEIAPGRPRQARRRIQGEQGGDPRRVPTPPRDGVRWAEPSSPRAIRRPGSGAGRAAEDGRRVVVLRTAGDGGRARGDRSLPGVLHARSRGGRARRGHLRASPGSACS